MKIAGGRIKKILTIAFLLTAILFAVMPAKAEMYKWVDENGVVHYSDTQPADGQKTETFETYEYTDPPPESSESVLDSLIETISEETKKIEDYLKEKKKAEGKPKANVEIFTTDWCRYCNLAIAFLQKNKVDYRQYDLAKDPVAAARKQQLAGGRGVPFAMINGKKVYGFSEENINRRLD